MRGAAVSNEVTRRLVEEHERHIAAWARARRKGTKDPPPSEEPGVRLLLHRLRVELVYDCGTGYGSSRCQAGGTGTEWRGEWAFRPSVPDAARRLVIHARPEGGRSLTPVELTLR